MGTYKAALISRALLSCFTTCRLVRSAEFSASCGFSWRTTLACSCCHTLDHSPSPWSATRDESRTSWRTSRFTCQLGHALPLSCSYMPFGGIKRWYGWWWWQACPQNTARASQRTFPTSGYNCWTSRFCDWHEPIDKFGNAWLILALVWALKWLSALLTSSINLLKLFRHSCGLRFVVKPLI